MLIEHLVRRLNELPELPLTQCRVERVGRQFHAVPVLTCPRIWNYLDQDIRVLLGDGHKLNGPGFDGSAVPDVPAKRSRRSEYPFHLPAVCLPAAAGTMKVTQKHTTSSLHLFLNRQDVWCTDISASLEICRFISSVCTERVGGILQLSSNITHVSSAQPAALRPSDIMSTWTIISKLLSGSETHDASTSAEIFQEIASITNALIRHRKDLVLPALPHLSMVLQRLVTMIRAIRPGLGAKQARTVANNFPFWVNSRQPLGLSEVRILSRLLVSLTTKTTVRLVGSAQENQKMESLARPFGKHASYVLIAYVQAMNDPLCVVYVDIRKELHPGLFALCDMLSDHDREAMMLSALDGGGKATMKALWNDYKKQKYAGQG
jgi:hypothetical protein